MLSCEGCSQSVRRKEEGERREREAKEEGEKQGEGGKGKEEKGGMEMMECIEMRVREKLLLIDLLNELVKGGVEIEEEEEMKEVLMELEEEGNKHVEEEMEGEGEEEMREWEELSEKACMLVRMMEKMKNRREGKKTATMKMSKRKEEEMEKKVEQERRGREEERKRADEEKRMKEEERRAFEERICRMEREMEEMKKRGVLHTPSPSNTPPIIPIASTVITSLDGTSVTFAPSNDGIKREGNTIIHHAHVSWRNCFIGGEMTSV